MMVPILPPVIISVAMTSVYNVMAVWMPVIVVPRSAATVAIDTFITELSNVIRNWLDASTVSTRPDPATATDSLPELTTAFPGTSRGSLR